MNKKFKRQIVVSTPRNNKNGYYRTVVLIVKDKPYGGTVGLCINRPAVVMPCDCGECVEPPAPLFLGGPEALDQSYFFMHDQKHLASKRDKILPGVYLSCPCTMDAFDKAIGQGKMITGFCYWNPGELEREIKDGLWLVDENPDPAICFDPDPKLLWKNMTPRHFSLCFSEN